MKRYFKAITIFFVMPLMFVGCRTNYQDQNFKAVINDEAKILNQTTNNKLTNYSYPKGFAFIIRTVRNLPKKEIGSMADKYFEEDAKKCPEPSACAERGVYIIVSQEPALIQVRAGSEIATQARWAGITSGQKYLEKQIPSTNGNFDSVLPDMVEWLSREFPNATDLPWYKRWILFDITQDLYKELEIFSLPSDGFYGKFILKLFLRARIIEENLSGTWWITYILASAFIFFIGFVIKKTVTLAIGKTNPQVANTMNWIIGIILKLLIAIPSAASVILLSGSRLEDQIALRSSGIPGAESFTFSPGSYVVETGILLALLLLIGRIIKGFAVSSDTFAFATLPDTKQQQIFAALKEKNPGQAWLIKGYATTQVGDIDYASSEAEFDRAPFTEAAGKFGLDSIKAGFKWGLLAWMFLPKALSLVALCLWIIPIVKGLIIFIICKIRTAEKT